MTAVIIIAVNALQRLVLFSMARPALITYFTLYRIGPDSDSSEPRLFRALFLSLLHRLMAILLVTSTITLIQH